MKSQPGDTRGSSLRMAARIRRFTRFRTTARLLTFWLTDSPKRVGKGREAKLSPFGESPATCATSPPEVLACGSAGAARKPLRVMWAPRRRIPLRYTALKSCRCLSRFWFGNTVQLLGSSPSSYCQASPPFGSACFDDSAAIFGAHADSEPRYSFSFAVGAA